MPVIPEDDKVIPIPDSHELIRDEDLDDVFDDVEEIEKAEAKEGDGKKADEVPAEGVYDVEGLGQLTAKQIKEWKEAQEKLQALEKDQQDLDDQMGNLEEEAARLEVWKQLDDLATRHPKLREKLNALFEEAASDPEFLETAPSDQKRGLNAPSRPKANSELDEAVKARLEFVDQLMVERAGTEIEGLVAQYSEKFPDVVKASQDWVRDVLRPAVIERFGEENVGLAHIRMTLNDIVVGSNGLDKAKASGAAALAKALADQPKGTTVVVPGSATRKQSGPTEKNWKKQSWNDIQASLVDDL